MTHSTKLGAARRTRSCPSRGANEQWWGGCTLAPEPEMWTMSPFCLTQLDIAWHSLACCFQSQVWTSQRSPCTMRKITTSRRYAQQWLLPVTFHVSMALPWQVLSVKPLEGTLEPQSSTFLHFTFRPLEASASPPITTNPWMVLGLFLTGK